MKLLSVNVGRPRQIFHEGRMIHTGIYKAPVAGPVRVNALNLEGDLQADLTVHGGPSKAVYVYPSEHYAFWRKELPQVEFPFGSFGENLSIEGLLEKDLNIGDRLCVGTVELAVTEPRLPCYKLGVKFKRDDMVKRFLTSRRTGFYCAVLREGVLEAGDAIHFLSRDEHHVTVADITRLYAFDKSDHAAMRRAAEIRSLSESWRGYFRQRLEKIDNA
ncbi:MAG: MOSC domain-containing protein [Deltaproteobacteria bacterium]|nr:MOSC domain-containing protein [Deltaproteobacteria bacterium]